MHKVLKVHYFDLLTSLCRDLGLDPRSTGYLQHRTRCEGITFLTKTLPRLSKAVLKSLEKGYFERPFGFKWKGASLELCSDWLNRIFDRKGYVRIDACPYALKSIRQLCEYFYKFAIPFTDKQLESAESKFLNTESLLSEQQVDRVWADEVRRLFETLYPSISRTSVHSVFKQAEPRFGPGAFAGSSNVRLENQAYKNRPDAHVGTTSTIYESMSGFFKPYPSCPERITIVEEGKTSEVVFVPKDSRGPRVISKEPMHLLKGQMAFFDWLSSSLERCSRKRINFKDQTVNQELARKGSIDRSVATLDLESASDMVRYDFAAHVFRNSPAIRWFLSNARSTHTKLPLSGKTIKIKKLSGMGSGITFPVMALLIQLSIVNSVRKTITHMSIFDIAKRVYVYGDDIIVPNSWYNFAVRGLTSSGLIVNCEKSYFRSYFRESCGGDYYKGVSVSPVRFKMSNNGIKSAPKGVVRSSVFTGDAATLQVERHCRELVKNHMIYTANRLYKYLERYLGDALPSVSGNSPCLGRWSLEPTPCRIKDTVEVIVPTAVTFYDRWTSPYKYLSRFFKLAEDAEWQGIFGFLAKSKCVKLKRKLVTYLTLVS